MKTLILFAEYLLQGFRAGRIRIIMFRQSLLKRHENRLQKHHERMMRDNKQSETTEPHEKE